MLKKLRNSNSGFTIIEVMIVLAIAALILLIVFLAVPALQRSSRNTQRKSDVGRLGSSVNTVIDNLNGQAVVTTGAGANLTGAIVTNEAGTLGYYTASNVSVTATIPATNTATKDTVIVVYGAKCNGSIASTTAARAVSIEYATETSGADSPACINE